jgi:hypothetical protein
MATILLAACVVACPLVMGAMMLSMRGGKPHRRRRQRQRSRGGGDGERT